MSGDHTGNWDSTQSIISQSAAIPPEYSGRPYVNPDFTRAFSHALPQVRLERHGHVRNR